MCTVHQLSYELSVNDPRSRQLSFNLTHLSSPMPRSFARRANEGNEILALILGASGRAL